jgi:succinate-acetate transporter protein
MKHLMTWATGAVPLLSSSACFAQGANMMNGDWWGGNMMSGYGGFWMAVAMIAVVAIVVWAILQNKK